MGSTALQLAYEIVRSAPVGRRSLAATLELSPASATRLVKELLGAGIVEEGEETQPTLGRPVVAVQPSSKLLLAGITFHTSGATAVLMDARGQVRESLEAELSDHSVAAVAALGKELLRELAAEADRPITATGVSLGGAISPAGYVTRAPFYGWRQVDLGAQWGRKKPTVFVNDADAFALGELWYGVGRQYSDFAIVTTGMGVGHAVVRERKLLDSPYSGIGLIGHVPVAGPEVVCKLGHRRCASAVLSMPALAHDMHAVGVPVADIADADQFASSLRQIVQEGDPAGIAVLENYAQALCRTIVIVGNVSMVSQVVVGGELAQLAGWQELAVKEKLAQMHDPDEPGLTLHVRDGAFVDWARGAAAVAFRTWIRHRLEK